MQKIVPFLWFDSQAEEAATFYTSIFRNSSIGHISRYGKEGYEIHGRPEGSAMAVDFQIEGQKFSALNGGPIFKINPSISFYVTCETESEIDSLWKRLSEGGSILMDIGKYDWSERYGWVQDQYGLSWQLSLGRLSDVGQKITPFLTFVGKQYGRAEEAVRFYTSVFKDSKIVGILKSDPGDQGTVLHGQFHLNDEVFMVSENDFEHSFAFNEAISFLVNCESQEEVDYFWEKLSEGGDPAAQQCGWLKDQFGVSWQIVPTVMFELLADKDRTKSGRVMDALLQMKKLDIAGLKRAYEGR